MIENNYYIGLDLGTDSLGWAVSNENYDLIRLKGKTAFGARIFSSAEDCKKRRMFRSSRRRLQRRKYRIYLLNQLLAEDINKVDSTFFERLKYSYLVLDDKSKKNISRNLLFKTRQQEVEFYKKYPTIWHLRNALINNNHKLHDDALSDIRNVYLALHHIIKYRGNFLSDGNINLKEMDLSLFDRLNKLFCLYIEDNDNIDVDFDVIQKSDYDKITKILEDKQTNKIQKKKCLKSLFKMDYAKDLIECFYTLIVGGDYDISKITNGESLKISFEKNYDEYEEIIKNELNENFEIIQIAKQIYDHILLKNLIGDKKSISEVMVEVYETHKQDLKLLKDVIIGIDKENGNHDLYKSIFKNEGKNNYSAFVHHNSDNDRITIDDFNVEIGKILDSNKDKIEEKAYQYLKEKTEKKKLLQIIANVSTSLIPHQLHLIELKIILDNAKKIYPTILENEDKIIKLFKFRVPYYFGPLDSRSINSNVDRKSNKTITPWNVEEIIDYSKTKTNFMKKLTSNCSYLYDCKVLPRASLIIEDYQIYDRLNALKINGAQLDLETKNKLYLKIISQNKTTIQSLKNYLKNSEGFKGNVLFDGIKEDVPFEASSHALLRKCFDLEKDFDLLERCIFLATIYADDKKAYFEEVENEFPTLTKEQYNNLKSITPKKWSRLSKELLTELYYVDENGVTHSILSLMKNTNKNFQQILFDKEYKFNLLIDSKNKEMSGEKTDNEIINNILENVPAITRRCINQTILVLDDIVKASKKEPAKIMIEVTRNEEKDKKEKDSRKKEVENFLNSIIKDSKNEYYKNQASKLVDELNYIENDANKLKGKHLYLYFKQMGCDMYTGEVINIHDVLNSNMYDTDHIIPQSLIKDDSLDNLVLVKRTINQTVKKDLYPIPRDIKTQKVKDLWKYLFSIKAISEKKYNNLIREKEITFEEIEQFVNRQINVIDYANISIKNILEIKYPNTKIIFSKSHYPSFLRKELNIVKNRDLNDAHHAVDAYLNVVCGNILSTRFNDIRKIYELKISGNKDKSTTFNMESVLLCEINKQKLFDKIKNNSFRHDALVTYKVDYNNGALYKQTIYKASNDESLIPIHTGKEFSEFNDTAKYGGYKSLSSSKMSVVTYTEKGKLYKKIISRKIIYDKQINNDEEYLKKILGDVSNPKSICDLYLNQKIEYDGGIYLLYTSNENQNKLKMAYQNYMDNNDLFYLNHVNKKVNDFKDDALEYKIKDKNDNLIVTISKQENEIIFNKIKDLLNNKIYDSCNYLKKLRDLDNLSSFNIKDQINIINNLIVAMSRNSEKSKLMSYYKEAGNAKLLITKDITKNNIKIIYESPTGLFVKKKKI